MSVGLVLLARFEASVPALDHLAPSREPAATREHLAGSQPVVARALRDNVELVLVCVVLHASRSIARLALWPVGEPLDPAAALAPPRSIDEVRAVPVEARRDEVENDLAWLRLGNLSGWCPVAAGADQVGREDVPPVILDLEHVRLTAVLAVPGHRPLVIGAELTRLELLMKGVHYRSRL